MNIFVVAGTHFSHPTKITSYHAGEHEAHVAATDLVNQLRADLDSGLLRPVDVESWPLGLVGAQTHHLLAQGVDIADMDGDTLADTAGFDVRIEKAEVQGLSALAVDDRGLSTILAALRSYQRRTCPPELADIATNGGRHSLMTADEIDDLCQRINCDTSPRQEANVVVVLEGGVVQNIVADRPVILRVVDYDVEGANPDEVVMIAQDTGDHAAAVVGRWAVNSICIDAEWIARLDAAIAPQS